VIAAALLRLLAKNTWSSLTLSAVARSAKLPLAQMFALAPSKPALVGVVLRELGRATAERYKPDRESRDPRERIFDVAMTWFDVQQRHKKALRNLYGGLRRDPFALMAARRDILASAEWLLALAEADSGASLPWKIAAFAGVLARATSVWLDDDAGAEKTMAQLDRDLGRIARLL
jgi:AcrR family transcriptional regulator